MDHSLEDGELSDDSDCYIPLQRPDNYSAFSNPITKPPVVSTDSGSPESTSSDSGSNSDGAVKLKRPKLKRPKLKLKPNRAQSKNRNTIWSTRIQEEVLVDTLYTCDVTKKDRSRDVESYDFPVRDDLDENFAAGDLREVLSRKNKPTEKDTEQTKSTRKNNKRSRDDRKNKHLRSVGRNHEEDDIKGTSRHLIDLTATMENSEEEIAKDLANKLFETKEDLLLKIVTVIGKQKSFDIYKDVKRIEEEGGMLIMNQSRRRTPGGVYLFLVKHEDSLTQDQRERIFEEDKQRMKAEERAKKKKKFSHLKHKNALGMDIKDLLTMKGELCIGKIEEKRWVDDKGETEHAEVENPPPTPETDCTDNVDDSVDHGQDSKLLVDEVSGRHAQEYDDDFLDLEANDMDLF